MKIRYLAIFLSLIAAIAFILPEVASARKSDDTIYLKEGKHSRDLENDLQIGAPSEKTDSLELSTAPNMLININCHEAINNYKSARGALIALMAEYKEGIEDYIEATGTFVAKPFIVFPPPNKLLPLSRNVGYAVHAVCDKCKDAPKVMKDDGIFCPVLGNPIVVD